MQLSCHAIFMASYGWHTKLGVVFVWPVTAGTGVSGLILWCCFALAPGKRKAGKYGDYSCDIPPITFETMLQHINKTHQVIINISLSFLQCIALWSNITSFSRKFNLRVHVHHLFASTLNFYRCTCIAIDNVLRVSCSNVHQCTYYW